MTEEKEKKLDFFDDIKDRILLIVVGLVSMATIVQLFINNFQDIFHLSACLSYWIFIVLYFITPLAFFVFYYVTVNYGTRVHLANFSTRPVYGTWATMKSMAYNTVYFIINEYGVLVPFVVFIIFMTAYLGTSCRWFSGIIAAFIIGIIILIIGSIIEMMFSEDIQNDDPDKRIYFKEFLLIVVCLTIPFLLLYVTNAKKIAKNVFYKESAHAVDSAFTYLDYSKKLDTFAARADTLERKCYKNAVITFLSDTLVVKKTDPKKVKESANTNKIVPATGKRYQDSAYSLLLSKIKKLDNQVETSKSLPQNFDFITLKRLDSITHPKKDTNVIIYDLFRKSLYLKDYASQIRTAGQEKTKEKWAIKINQLQFKSLIWLLMLILLCLRFWLKLTYQLVDRKSKNYRLTRNLELIQASAKENKRKQKEIAINNRCIAINAAGIKNKTERISQVKTFIYVLLLLVLPFFKPVEKEDINLSKPFLNFSPINIVADNRLADPEKKGQEKEGGETGQGVDINLMLKNIDLGTQKIYNSVDTNAKREQASIDTLNNQITDLAKQVIGYPEIFDAYRNKHPYRPKENPSNTDN